MNTLQELDRYRARAAQGAWRAGERSHGCAGARARNAITSLASANADMLAKQARVSAVDVVATAPQGNNARSTASFDVAVVYERQIDVAAERERLTKELTKYDKGIEAAERQLGNEGFVAKAPAHIVEGLKKQAAETRALKEKAEAALAALPR